MRGSINARKKISLESLEPRQLLAADFIVDHGVSSYVGTDQRLQTADLGPYQFTIDDRQMRSVFQINQVNGSAMLSVKNGVELKPGSYTLPISLRHPNARDIGLADLSVDIFIPDNGLLTAVAEKKRAIAKAVDNSLENSEYDSIFTEINSLGEFSDLRYSEELQDKFVASSSAKRILDITTFDLRSPSDGERSTIYQAIAALGEKLRNGTVSPGVRAEIGDQLGVVAQTMLEKGFELDLASEDHRLGQKALAAKQALQEFADPFLTSWTEMGVSRQSGYELQNGVQHSYLIYDSGNVPMNDLLSIRLPEYALVSAVTEYATANAASIIHDQIDDTYIYRFFRKFNGKGYFCW